MAFSSTRSSLFVFIFLTLLFSIQTNARDSSSFGKFQREYPKEQNPNNLQTNETSEQDDQNPTFMPETENGYGLYGQETTYNNNEDQLNNKKYDENVNYDDSFSTPSLSQTQTQTQESYKSYGENYPKMTESYDENNKDTSYYESSNGFWPKREKEAYKGYGNNVERQGMSDTRFMANGKYYFDLDDERNHGRFYQKHHYYNYNPTNYNEKDSSVKNTYDSKNMMNEQSEVYGERPGDMFTP